MFRYLTAIGTILIASQADALSCLPPNPIRATEAAVESTDRFVMAYGQLQAVNGRPDRPNIDPNNQNPSAISYEARFVGMSASRRAFDTPIDARITVTETCLAVWCGRATLNTQMLVFLKQQAGRYSIETGPCDMGGGFPNLSRGDLRAVLRCAFQSDCDAERFELR